MWVHRLADADASCGGKAVGLARLIAAGLPVPDGFVIDHHAFDHLVGELELAAPHGRGHQLTEAAERIERAAIPPALIAEVAAHLPGMPALAVRSSATIEDVQAGAAAGVFSSRGAVAPDAIWDAVRAVWISALTPLAAAYARHRGAAIAIAVIVQRQVEGARVTVYTRPPGAPSGDQVWIQRDGQVSRQPRTDRDSIVELALRAEAALDAPAGADVELIVGETMWVVQARPIVHPTVRSKSPPPPIVIEALEATGRRWTWDVAHNPDPLSVAQAELVDRVERAGFAPWSLRVTGGYLYTAPREPAPLPREHTRDLATIEAELAALVTVLTGSLTIAEAVDRYLAFYRVWATELVPRIAAARVAEGPSRPGERPSAVESVLLAAARGQISEADVNDRLGTLAPAWDVAVPTFAERPGLLRDAIARARSRSEGGSIALTADPSVEPAHSAADLGERDDLWFARAQWLVRRALIARGAELALEDGDVFWIPFGQLEQPAEREPPRQLASAARRAAERASAWTMPIVIGGPAVTQGSSLHGIGSGPRVTGRVVRFDSLASAIPVGPADVVVTRAVTPATAVFIIGCAALVSETGGPLDHGAALARELGIPHVVGCHEAWSRLANGMIVTVDADAGVVEIDSSLT